jgi:transposase-like protein
MENMILMRNDKLVNSHDYVCYEILMNLLHPEGIVCPRCGVREGLRVHRRHREPVVDYLCTGCFRVFNAWTGTVLQGTHRPPSQIISILDGFASGVTTAQLARWLECRRPGLVPLRRRWLPLALQASKKGGLPRDRPLQPGKDPSDGAGAIGGEADPSMMQGPIGQDQGPKHDQRRGRRGY